MHTKEEVELFLPTRGDGMTLGEAAAFAGVGMGAAKRWSAGDLPGNVQFLAHFDSGIASRWKGGRGPPRDDSSCRDKKHTGGRPCPNAASIAWALLSAVGHLLLRYRSVWGMRPDGVGILWKRFRAPLAVGIWLESIHIYSPYD